MQTQQSSQVGRRVPMGLVSEGALSVQGAQLRHELKQPLLYCPSIRIGSSQLHKKWSDDQSFLGLAPIIGGLRLFECVLDRELQSSLFDLPTHVSNEP